jgi:ABC-type amino acid transport substrate-binding protein
MKSLIRVVLIHFLLLGFNLYAKDTDGLLIIGTKVAPPFAMKSVDGNWSGVSIDLWKEIAKKLNLQYRFEEDTLEELMDKIKNKNIEIAIAAITATSSREKFADFSNGYYTEELSIAIPKCEGTIFKSIFEKLFSYTTLWVLIGIAIVIHIAGFAFWLMERSDRKSNKTKNSTNDKENEVSRISHGIWWATVTMATVGRGNIVPKTVGGKVVAVIWMFLSMFLVAIIIAAFASLFTQAEKEYFISSPKDLNKGKIGTINGSFSDDYLRKRGIIPIYYNSLKDALNAIETREVDAVVYDKDLLEYIIQKDFKDSLELSKEHFMPQNYSLIFKEDCNIKEPINRALLEVIESDKWKSIKDKYLKDN